MAKRGTWTKLGQQKVESSGLTIKVAEQLGMYEVPSAKQLDQTFDARPALVIPYHDEYGKPLSAHPKWPNFYRIRYLGEPPKDAPSFSDVTDKTKKKEIRYVQPPRTGVCAYLPLLEGVNWAEIAKDTSQDLIITEGELKSAAGTFFGAPTIGLGGVHSFKAMTEGVLFLPELARFNWIMRNVYIVYDSDFAQNPFVCGAINSLAEELQMQGAIPKVVFLPEVKKDSKTGLDDYLLEQTVDELGVLLAEAEPLSMSRSLWRANDEVIYINDPGMIVVQDDSQKISVDAFKNHSRWATEATVDTRVTPNGDVVRERVALAPTWIKWPLRRSAPQITYAPGKPKITEAGYYNQWPGWGVVPRKGDVKPFLSLVNFIFQESPQHIDWFLDWCAYPIQNPGTKMFVACVIHGIHQGTGKTLIGYTLGEIYGKNFKEIKDEDLEQSYWAENKQFILGDEVSGKDNRQYANTLKRLITAREVDINIKFVPQYTLPNAMNFMFTSQHADSFFLEDRDRRFFVIDVQAEPQGLGFYENYDEWLWRGDGPSYLMQFLLDRKINPKFSPSAPAPSTAAKDRMIQATKGDVASWVSEMMNYPDQVLRIGEMVHSRDLFTTKELLAIYTNEHPNNKVTANGMSRVLTAAGCLQVDGGSPIRGPDGKMSRYFAVRNLAHWKKCKKRTEMEKNAALPPVRGVRK